MWPFRVTVGSNPTLSASQSWRAKRGLKQGNSCKSFFVRRPTVRELPVDQKSLAAYPFSNRVLRLPDDSVGRRCRRPACGARFVIPDARASGMETIAGDMWTAIGSGVGALGVHREALMAPAPADR